MHPSDFVESLSLVDIRVADDTAGLELVGIKKPTDQPMPDTADLKAAVNAGSILSFVDGLDDMARQDVLYSTQLAQRAANSKFDRFSEIRHWYGCYLDVLQNLGWVGEQFAFTEYREDEGEMKMDAAAIKIIAAIATQNQLAIIMESLKALESLQNDDKQIQLFDFHSSAQLSGNFQIGAVQQSANGALAVALGAFYFKANDNRRKFLFFSWGKQSVNFWTAAQKMTLNRSYYDLVRDDVKGKLASDAGDFLAAIKL